MRGIGVCFLMLMTVACDVPQGVQDEIACTTLCRCFTTIASEEEACIDECIEDLAPVQETCATCVNLHANECSTVVEDCGAVCFQAQPLETDQGEP